MQQFSDVVDGIAEACNALGTPITGGNVSLYNETLGEGIYPTPVIGVVGIIEDVTKIAYSYFRGPGRDILLLRSSCGGDEPERTLRFGSSEYARTVLREIWGQPPALDLEKEAALHKCLFQLIGDGLIESAHDCSDGGVAVALAECCFPKGVGAKAEVKSHKMPAELSLFGEAATRVVLSCDPKHSARIQEIAVQSGLTADLYGQTQADCFEITVDGKSAIMTSVSDLKQVWSNALEVMLQSS